ncbi:uncharacterized protein RHO25_011708 [Cercospora beticola]|uniref:Uncharacterized protein n=1 Tax=Cercospora beticola TaxID=122368 RepID=A0ABZ0P5G3_CERBT|nr:hypothetical protein RHO25_011708 [Cercospora beticola]
MATHVVCFDDEIAVLIMQMEEYGLLAEQDKGKYLPDDPPDFTLALRIFIKELHAYKCYLEDHKLARSICSAVHEDDAIIAALTSEDLKAHEDRQLALRLSADLGSPYQPHTAESDPSSLSEWTSRLAETVGANSLTQTIEDDDQHAGPSRTFAERQGDLLAKLSEGFTCNMS